MQDFETVAVFTYPSELAPARAFLESEGVPTCVRDELTVQVHNFYSNAIGGIRLEVPESDVDRASELLLINGFEEHVINRQEVNDPEDGDFYENTFGASRQKVLLWIVIFLLISLFIWFSLGLW